MFSISCRHCQHCRVHSYCTSCSHVAWNDCVVFSTALVQATGLQVEAFCHRASHKTVRLVPHVAGATTVIFRGFAKYLRAPPVTFQRAVMRPHQAKGLSVKRFGGYKFCPDISLTVKLHNFPVSCGLPAWRLPLETGVRGLKVPEMQGGHYAIGRAGSPARKNVITCYNMRTSYGSKERLYHELADTITKRLK